MNNSRLADGRRWARSLQAVIASLVLATAMAFPATGARAADYPARPIRAVVPFGPGGLTDIAARLVAQEMGKELKQTIFVENRAGALGNLGMTEVARTPADGYTIMFNGSSATMNPALFRTLNYDPLKDLRPVGMISQSPYVVAVNATLPVATLDALVKYMIANPGKLNVGFAGAGTRLATELLMLQNNIKAELIPYKSTGAMALAVAQNEVQLSIMDSSSVLPFLSTGQIKVLAVSGEHRLGMMADVPTTAEAGFPLYNPTTSTALFVPGGTPDSVVNLLSGALNKVLEKPEIKQRIEQWGARATPMDQAKITSWYTGEIALWKDLVTKAKIPFSDD